MTECVACHECANSESDYDSEFGAHSSFTRCGERSQGQGGLLIFFLIFFLLLLFSFWFC